MANASELVIDEIKINKAIQSGIPLTITTSTLPRKIEICIERVIELILKSVDQEKLKDYIVYCIHELAVNAKKANTKRVYFMERGLDLTDPNDYQRGMQNFKEDTLCNVEHYMQLQREKGLYIKLVLAVKNNTILFEVHNNVSITKTELIRIRDKLARSRQYNSLKEALSLVLDNSEGAGLGLIIMVLMLKKIGLNEDYFNIAGTENKTVAKIKIPLKKTRLENLSILSEAIVNNINSLPQFPENILHIQKLIAEPKSDMTIIARKISTDPALTADLLKIVNSGQYMLSKKVVNIFDAVKTVGIKGIKNLLYSYGTQKILGEDTPAKKQLWEHSYRTAFYAYNLIKNFKNDKALLDDVYAGGILHDMGKIIFSDVHPELLTKIREFCADKGIPASTFEALSAGMNHAELGALVAEKWNFPDSLIYAIRYHHDPAAAQAEYKNLVDSVYLANMFCEYENGAVAFDQLEPSALENFGITSRNQIDSLLELFSKEGKK